tara:strand:- start:69 stop:497 length:429 start_codon:yes stop_codon:yes gene_type:complete
MGFTKGAFVDIGIETDIYASGDALGEKNSFDGVPSNGKIMTVVVQDRASQNVDFDIVMFDTDITGTTDNAAFDPTDAELQTCIGSITVTGYKSFNDNSIATVDDIGLAYEAGDRRIYFQCVTRGTPTYVAATDVRVRLVIEF